MKKWIVRIVLAIVVLGLLAAAGFAIYRVGYTQGVLATSTGEGVQPGWLHGRLPGGPMEFHERFITPRRSFDEGYFPMSGSSRGGLFFSPLAPILGLAFFGVVVWLIYKFVIAFTRGQGWQLTFRPHPEEKTTSDTVQPVRSKK